ncbi:hypothetical protein EMIT0P291_100039 [Pseudomonas sp. IT-P291]
MGFRKSIDNLAAPGETGYQGSSVPLGVFLCSSTSLATGEERNGSCLWLKCLKPEHFKTSPDLTNKAIVLSTQEFNGLLDDLIIGAAIRLRFFGLNNWLFSDTTHAARASVQRYSVIETAKPTTRSPMSGSATHRKAFTAGVVGKRRRSHAAVELLARDATANINLAC